MQQTGTSRTDLAFGMTLPGRRARLAQPEREALMVVLVVGIFKVSWEIIHCWELGSSVRASGGRGDRGCQEGCDRCS